MTDQRSFYTKPIIGRVRRMSIGLTDKRTVEGYIGASVEPKLAAAFHAEAERRGMSSSAFIRRLIRIIAKDNLFSAILDDT